jgi:uncharacterized SAM-binding protein YcdF (DUF218 family)
MARSGPVRFVLWRTVSSKQRWSLTWRGWLLVVFFVGAVSTVIVRASYPFLALTNPVDAEYLVLEGWVHEYAARAAVVEFTNGRYRKAFSTGGPVSGLGGYVNDFQTAASVGADRLINAGLQHHLVEMVPDRHPPGRDRTYQAAVALRDWFSTQNIQVRSINIVTEDLHARRSRLLFQKALGPQVRVGVIAVPNPDYDAGRWWRYSAGVKDMISEGAAYLYVKLFFHPDKPSP